MSEIATRIYESREEYGADRLYEDLVDGSCPDIGKEVLSDACCESTNLYRLLAAAWRTSYLPSEPHEKAAALRGLAEEFISLCDKYAHDTDNALCYADRLDRKENET